MKLKRLTDDAAEDSWPNWHPGGGKLAFTSNRDGNFEIYTMNAAGQIIENITNDPRRRHPTRVVRGTLERLPSLRNGVRRLETSTSWTRTEKTLQNLTNHRAKDSHPAWSPDNEKIAWITERSGHAEIFVMGANGKNQIKIGWLQRP